MIPPHPLTNFEMQMYYQNEPRLNDVYSRDNVPDETKDRAYVNNHDEYSYIGTHYMELYANIKTVTQLQLSVMRESFCIEFINFMLKRNSLADFTNLFSSNNFKKKKL